MQDLPRQDNPYLCGRGGPPGAPHSSPPTPFNEVSHPRDTFIFFSRNSAARVLGTFPPEPHSSIPEALSPWRILARGHWRPRGWGLRAWSAAAVGRSWGARRRDPAQSWAYSPAAQTPCPTVPGPSGRYSSVPPHGGPNVLQRFLFGGQQGRAKGKSLLSECPGPAQWPWGRYSALFPKLLASEGRWQFASGWKLSLTRRRCAPLCS